jgi:hypothetical protein
MPSISNRFAGGFAGDWAFADRAPQMLTAHPEQGRQIAIGLLAHAVYCFVSYPTLTHARALFEKNQKTCKQLAPRPGVLPSDVKKRRRSI